MVLHYFVGTTKQKSMSMDDDALEDKTSAHIVVCVKTTFSLIPSKQMFSLSQYIAIDAFPGETVHSIISLTLSEETHGPWN